MQVCCDLDLLQLLDTCEVRQSKGNKSQTDSHKPILRHEHCRGVKNNSSVHLRFLFVCLLLLFYIYVFSIISMLVLIFNGFPRSRNMHFLQPVKSKTIGFKNFFFYKSTLPGKSLMFLNINGHFSNSRSRMNLIWYQIKAKKITKKKKENKNKAKQMKKPNNNIIITSSVFIMD